MQHVQATQLHDAGAIGAADGKHRFEVKIVGEDGINVGQGPLHQGSGRAEVHWHGGGSGRGFQPKAAWT